MLTFTGFYTETVEFFGELTEHNSSEWFEAHRNEYEEFVREPSRAYIEAMGARLKAVAPGVHAIPKVNKGLFRINRDIRFSPDKSPYKTHLGLWIWEGSRKRMESSGFYFHLAPDHILFGVGIHTFSPALLARYREALVDKRAGRAFEAMIAPMEALPYAIGGCELKRTPRGFDPDHPNALYLRHKGLTMSLEEPVSSMIYGAELIEYAFSHYEKMLPLHQWLLKYVAP